MSPREAVLSDEGLTEDLGRRTAAGGLVVVAGQGLSMGVQFAGLVIMGRLLEPADFGLVAMAAAVTTFATIFADLGLATATIQRRRLDQDLVSALFLLNLAAATGIMLLAWAAAPLAGWFYGDARVSWVVAALAATLPVTALGLQHRALLTRRMRWTTLRATLLASEIAGLAVAASLAAFTSAGYWALVANAWITACVAAALYWYHLPWRPGRVRRWREARGAVGFGLHLTGAGVIFWVARQLDNVLVGARWGDAVLGQYSRAYAVYLLPVTLVSGPLQSAMVPALSRLADQPERWRGLLLDVQAALFLASGLVAALLIAGGETLMVILLGPEWAPAGDILQILSLSVPAMMVANTAGWIFVSRGRSDRMLRWNLARLPVLVGGFLLGLPYGALGMAVAVSALSWLLAVPNIAFAAHGSPVSAKQIFGRALLPWAAVALAALAGSLAGAALDGPAILVLLLELGTAAAVYALIGVPCVFLHPHYRAFRRWAGDVLARRGAPLRPC